MDTAQDRKIKIKARHKRIRKKIFGDGKEPRLFVRRSLNNIYAQFIDDSKGKVLFGMSTLNKDIKEKIEYGGNLKAAEVLGEAIAEEAKKRGIKKIHFDRGGYIYHGRVKAFADSVRKGGMEF